MDIYAVRAGVGTAGRIRVYVCTFYTHCFLPFHLKPRRLEPMFFFPALLVSNTFSLYVLLFSP